MGLADRPYMHEDAPRRGGSGGAPGRFGAIRGLSVTMWLIIACVAVFVLDGFIPVRWSAVGIEWVPGVQFSTPADEQAMLKKLVPGPLVPQVTPGRGAVPGSIGVRILSDAAGKPMAREVLVAEPLLKSLLYFSTSRALVHQAPDGSLRGFEFWRFLGFQFLHDGIWHLALNMIGLWFFGPIVERTLGGKRYLAFYLLCGICGALMYLLLNAAGAQLVTFFGPSAATWAPFLLFNNPQTPLIGASAGVFGVLMAGAYLVPHAKVLVWGILPMRLDTMAYALVGIAILSIFLRWSNAGGEAAHLGGAVAGWYFIRHPKHLHGFFNVMGRVDPTSRNRQLRSRGGGRSKDETVEIDRILRKVYEQGLHALTDAERTALRAASAKRPD